jgi:hypothetical protein
VARHRIAQRVEAGNRYFCRGCRAPELDARRKSYIAPVVDDQEKFAVAFERADFEPVGHGEHWSRDMLEDAVLDGFEAQFDGAERGQHAGRWC